jgi:hypothetical protein
MQGRTFIDPQSVRDLKERLMAEGQKPKSKNPSGKARAL